jgi:hypothetical protein
MNSTIKIAITGGAGQIAYSLLASYSLRIDESAAAFLAIALPWDVKIFALDSEKILALHPGLAGHGANEQCPIHIAKALIKIRSGNNVSEEGKRAVLELHHHPFERFERGRYFYETELDRPVRTQCSRGRRRQSLQY